MSDLDHLDISRALGSTVQSFPRVAFGGFGQARATGEMLAARPAPVASLRPDAARDAAIVEAFSLTHDGYSVDRVLADPDITGQFLGRCQRLGVTAPHAAVCRRLLRIRKSGQLKVPTTREESRNLEPFLIPAELAFSQLTYQHDASYDDLLAEPKVGSAFDLLAAKLGRGRGARVDYRLAALHLRKNVRSRSGVDAGKLGEIGTTDLTSRWHQLGSLARVRPDEVPEGRGILSLSEPNRHLYLTQHPNLRAGLAVFQDRAVLDAMGNRFWSPSPDGIAVRVMKPEDAGGSNLRLYELRALEVYRPIFNMLLTAA